MNVLYVRRQMRLVSKWQEALQPLKNHKKILSGNLNER
jgi:hypothetical protein